jgi:hypothetical protein
MLPEGPVVAPFRAPVIHGVANAFAGENFGEAIGGAAVLPGTGAGNQVDVARIVLLVIPAVGKIGKVIDGIVEVKIAVVHAIHEISEIVDAGHGKATLEYIGMLEESVGGVIGAEGSAHRGNADLRLAMTPDEGNNFFTQVGIENGLYVAAVKRVSALVVEAETVDGIDGIEFDAAGIDKIAKSADHSLALEFEFIASTGGKTEERRAPMSIGNDAKIQAEARRVPAVVFTFHSREPFVMREEKYASGRKDEQGDAGISKKKWRSVGFFRGRGEPGLERAQRVGMGKLRDGETASVWCATELVVYKGVIETSGGGIGGGGSEENTVKPRPIDCAEAHGTRFAGSIEIAATQLEIAEDATSLANSFDLGVGGRIDSRGDPVDCFGDDLAFLHDQGSEGTTLAGVYIFDGQGDGALQEWIGHDGASPAIQSAARGEDSQYGLDKLERKGALVTGNGEGRLPEGPTLRGELGLQGTRMRVG